MQNHINIELDRIEARLAAYPDPFEHAGLYAAQQALRWVTQPESFASPYSVVTRQSDTTAQGIEAAAAGETPKSGSTEGESPVLQEDAPKAPNHPSQGGLHDR